MGGQGPMEGGQRGIATFALALATFMQVLDTTIANVSIPTIAGDLGVSSDQGTWIITSFAVANAISLPMTGWLMRRYGVVKTFVASVVLFTIASFLCGIAWSLPSLIGFRVLQGLVSGPMIPGSQALLLSLYPAERKGSALAVWSMTTLVAPICGPILGGWISDNHSWSWIFLINVPVGIFAALVCWQLLKHRETPTTKLPIDAVGLGLLVLWVGSLQLMLDQGKDLDWFSSTWIVSLAIVSAIAFVAWLIWELTEEHPIVDLTLFKSRNFLLGCFALAIAYALFFGNVVILPLWLQTQIGYTATWAGLVAAPSGLVAVILSPFVGRIIGKSDARWLATIAFGAFAVSYFMRAGLTADASFYSFVAPLLVQGIGMGLFFIAMLTITLDGLPPDKVPAASGLSNFVRITAGSFATSITTTLWDRREALHQSHLVEHLTPYDRAYQQAMAQLHAAGATDPVANASILKQVVSQGYLMASTDIFYASGWLVLLLFVPVWLARRPRAGSAPAAAAD